jgi:hypothetical protein
MSRGGGHDPLLSPPYPFPERWPEMRAAEAVCPGCAAMWPLRPCAVHARWLIPGRGGAGCGSGGMVQQQQAAAAVGFFAWAAPPAPSPLPPPVHAGDDGTGGGVDEEYEEVLVLSDEWRELFARRRRERELSAQSALLLQRGRGSCCIHTPPSRAEAREAGETTTD